MNTYLQQALYDKLTSPSIGFPVYDYVQPETVMPFAYFSDGSSMQRQDTKNSAMESHTVEIGFYCQAKGQKQPKQMMAAVEARLHDAELTLGGGYYCISCRLENSELNLVDEDIYSGSQRYTVLVSQ